MEYHISDRIGTVNMLKGFVFAVRVMETCWLRLVKEQHGICAPRYALGQKSPNINGEWIFFHSNDSWGWSIWFNGWGAIYIWQKLYLFMVKEFLTRRGGPAKSFYLEWWMRLHKLLLVIFGFKLKCNSSISMFLSPDFFCFLMIFHQFFRKQLRTKGQKKLVLNNGFLKTGRCRTWVIFWFQQTGGPAWWWWHLNIGKSTWVGDIHSHLGKIPILTSILLNVFPIYDIL